MLRRGDIYSLRMFERYTENARRLTFFARYEAGTYGSPYIESEHVLLGLLREDTALAYRLGNRIVESEIRAEIETRITRRERFSTSVEVPLSGECKSVLNFAADAAEKFGHRFVGTEHLLLGILRADTSLAAQVLVSRGLKPEHIHEQMAKAPGAPYGAAVTTSAQVTLESFLAGLKSLKSEQLIYYFAKDAECIDASGQRWNRDELWKGFDKLFAHYAKKNATYTIETVLAQTRELLVATVLWKNALLASEERVWMHRMCTVLLVESGWKILFLQMAAVVPTDKKRGASAPD